MKPIISVFVIVFCLGACSAERDTPATKDKHLSPTTMIYSPNGEPLNGGPLGKPSCEQAVGAWFDRLSAGTDGHISLLSFISDAQTQFQRMDIDHNGYIVSEELDRFREPYRQQQPPVKIPKEVSGDEGQKDHRHKSKEGRDAESASHSDPSLSLSDPVMSADANLDFKVTSEEFMNQARDNFSKLDTNHNDSLERSEILTICEQKKP